MAIRICNKCELPKDLEKDFNKNKKNKEGRNTICKFCWKEHYDKIKSDKKNEWFNFN